MPLSTETLIHCAEIGSRSGRHSTSSSSCITEMLCDNEIVSAFRAVTMNVTVVGL